MIYENGTLKLSDEDIESLREIIIPKGKWKLEQGLCGYVANCSQCRNTVDFGFHGSYDFKYCPYCGSRNEVKKK